MSGRWNLPETHLSHVFVIWFKPDLHSSVKSSSSLKKRDSSKFLLDACKVAMSDKQKSENELLNTYLCKFYFNCMAFFINFRQLMTF